MRRPVLAALSVCAPLLALCPPLLALGGCDFAPSLQLPETATPALYKTPLPPGSSAALTEHWWRDFRSPELDRLEARVEADNPDYAAALARYERAKAVLDLNASAFFPQVSSDQELSFNKQSQQRPLRSANQPTYYGGNQLLGQVSWEIDLWGRVRDLVKAAQAGAQANEDLLAATRASLHASLARLYIALRGADAQSALLTRTIGVYAGALKLTQERLKQNIAPPIDVERAKVQLATAQAVAASIAQERAVLENAIGAVVGETPSLFRIRPEPRQPAFPRPPRVAPAVLLLRRPDVAANERLLFAANESIGVAKADFLPRFYLALSGGTQSTNLDLMNFHNSVWSYGPNVTAPIFDGGQRQANLDVARANFNLASAAYKASVLAAFQEVENATASIKLLGEQDKALATAAQAAQRALDMATSLYKDGAVSSLDLITAQTAALDAERSELNVQTQLLGEYADLALALGGGWTGQAPPPEPTEQRNIAVLGWQGRDPGQTPEQAATQQVFEVAK